MAGQRTAIIRYLYPGQGLVNISGLGMTLTTAFNGRSPDPGANRARKRFLRLSRSLGKTLMRIAVQIEITTHSLRCRVFGSHQPMRDTMRKLRGDFNHASVE
jgi:hypothetical protein